MSKCECENITHFEPTMATKDGSPNHEYGVHFEAHDLKPVKTVWGTFFVCAKCNRECYGSKEQGRVTKEDDTHYHHILCRCPLCSPKLIKENEVKESAGSQGS